MIFITKTNLISKSSTSTPKRVRVTFHSNHFVIVTQLFIIIILVLVCWLLCVWKKKLIDQFHCFVIIIIFHVDKKLMGIIKKKSPSLQTRMTCNILKYNFGYSRGYPWRSLFWKETCGQGWTIDPWWSQHFFLERLNYKK